MFKYYLFGALLAIVGIFLGMFVVRMDDGRSIRYFDESDSYTRSFKDDVFYSVFLDNQQVYFGKIVSEDSHWLEISEVFYLKSSADVKQQDLGGNKAKVSLVKLGKELHTPRDTMLINRYHVLFVEEMRESGTIIDEIMNYEEDTE